MGQHKVLPVRYRMADPVVHNKINLLGCLKPWWCGFQASSLSLLLLPLCLLFSPSITVHHHGILPWALLGASWQHISQLRALQDHCSSLLKLHPLKYAAFRIIFPHGECLRLYKTHRSTASFSWTQKHLWAEDVIQPQWHWWRHWWC